MEVASWYPRLNIDDLVAMVDNLRVMVDNMYIVDNMKLIEM